MPRTDNASILFSFFYTFYLPCCIYVHGTNSLQAMLFAVLRFPPAAAVAAALYHLNGATTKKKQKVWVFSKGSHLYFPSHDGPNTMADNWDTSSVEDLGGWRTPRLMRPIMGRLPFVFIVDTQRLYCQYSAHHNVPVEHNQHGWTTISAHPGGLNGHHESQLELHSLVVLTA